MQLFKLCDYAIFYEIAYLYNTAFSCDVIQLVTAFLVV